MRDREILNENSDRYEDKIDRRFDQLDARLRTLEHRIAYAAGGVMAIQTLISVAIRLFWNK